MSSSFTLVARRMGKISPVLIVALGFCLLAIHADDLSVMAKNAPSNTETEPAAASNILLSQKAAETPHFWQRDPRGEFENDGRDFCCPVAVSNSLCYLAHHGFPALLSDGKGVQPQIDLINLLATPDYMGTDPDIGTAPGAVLSGVQKYVTDKGYRCERLEYEGWRKVGRNHESLVKAAKPGLEWLKQGISDPHGAVWLNLGWYTKVDDGEWKRTGGHWVTVVGFDANDSSVLWIHNPATRANNDKPDDPAKDVVRLQLTTEGTLDTGKDSTEDAAGRYQVSGPGLPISHGVDAAFLDAAIVMVIGD